MSLPVKQNPVFRGYRIRLVGKGGQRPLRYATHAFIYYPGAETVRVDFPPSKKKISEREAYLYNRITRMDRERKREEEEAKKKKERKKKEREQAKLKREVQEIYSQWADMVDAFKEVEREFRDLLDLNRDLKDEIKKLKEGVEEELPIVTPPEKPPLEKLPPMEFSQSDLSHFTNRHDSVSEVTANLAGNRISSTIQDLDFKIPLVINKQNKVYYLDLLKRKFQQFAKEHFEEIPGRGEFLIRLKTFENHITQGKRNSGFWAHPGRVAIDSMEGMMEAVEILFSSFGESFDQYIKQMVTRSIGIRGFSIEQVSGIARRR